jgi:hypothetical protein
MALEDYPDGTCFRTAFIGHASAMSQAYYSPLRGASLSLFRHSFVLNFMQGTWRLPSLLGQVVEGEILHEMDSVLDVAAGTQSGNATAAVAQHVIYIYNKTKDDFAPGFRCGLSFYCVVFAICAAVSLFFLCSYVWPDICSLQHEIRLLVPGSRVECVNFQGTDLGLQMQMASEATLHITPHGGVAYSLLFSRPGSSAIVLVDSLSKAKDLYILTNLPWLFVMYLHRDEEHLVHAHIMHAVVQASLRLGISVPGFDFDAAEPFLRRRLAARAAAAEEEKLAKDVQELHEVELMKAAAMQVADDVEESNSLSMSLEFERSDRRSEVGTRVQLLARGDSNCAVFSNESIFCWGQGAVNDDTHSLLYRPVPVRTHGAYMGRIHLIGMYLNKFEESRQYFLCGRHAESIDASSIERGANDNIGCIRNEPKLSDDKEGGRVPKMFQLVKEPFGEDIAEVIFGVDGLVLSCYIMRVSGELQCAGHNEAGQLGDGTRETRNNICPLHYMEACRVPLPLPIMAVSVGSVHVCAVVGKGAVYVKFLGIKNALSLHFCSFCWGSNAGAQLGDGSNLNDENRTLIQPRPIMVSGMHAGASSVTVTFDRTHIIMANGVALPLASPPSCLPLSCSCCRGVL